uniref:Uncharacterized protein n=1 Tax=Strongyloides stercoralis TaxID=6248 RepID=A0A0K0E6C3_STRER
MLSIIRKLPSFAVFFLMIFIYLSKTLPINDKNLIKNSYNLKEAPVVLNNEVDDHVLKKRQRGAARRRRRNRREIRNLVSGLSAQLVQLQLQVQVLQQQLSSRVLLLTTTMYNGKQAKLQVLEFENLRITVEKAVQPKTITVWCDENREAITVNGNRYKEMIQNFLILEIKDEELMCFQKDRAPSHKVVKTLK